MSDLHTIFDVTVPLGTVTDNKLFIIYKYDGFPKVTSPCKCVWKRSKGSYHMYGDYKRVHRCFMHKNTRMYRKSVVLDPDLEVTVLRGYWKDERAT